MDLKPDRRGQPRSEVDRRRSARWAARKGFAWRLQSGRRVRHAVVVERSLDGFVLLTKKKDLPEVGKRIHPANPEQFDRLGFRAAIVRGIASRSHEEGLIFAEFEA